MTNEKNTDNNNPKSDVAMLLYEVTHQQKICVLPFSKTFKTPFTTLENIFH